jgi:hypothetical protein
MQRASREPAKAFTLTEQLVTMLLFTVVLIGGLEGVSRLLQLREVSQDYIIAASELQRLMERMTANRSAAQIVAAYPAGLVELALVGGGQLPSEQLSVTYPDGSAASPLSVRIEVAWQRGGHIRRVAVSTLRMRQ